MKTKVLAIVVVFGVYVGVVVSEIMKIEEQRMMHNISSSMEVAPLIE